METSDDQATDISPARARSLANLAPRFLPGRSGNPSGLAKDGGSSKEAPIRAKLRARLAKRRALERLVDTWISAACDGDSAAREQILKRLDPITDAGTDARQVVFEGLRLELPNGARAEVIRGKLADLGLTAGEARTPILENGGASLLPAIDVVHETSESRAG